MHVHPHIIEVIVQRDVEVDDAMVDELHSYLSANEQETSCILINVKNDYTYNFSAQRRIGLLPHVNAIACVAHREASRITSQLLKNMRKNVSSKMEIFDDYDAAIEWLQSQTT